MLQCLISRSGETWLSEKDDEYIYFEQLITMKNDFPEEENRKVGLHGAYGRHSDLGKGNRTVCFQMKDI